MQHKIGRLLTAAGFVVIAATTLIPISRQAAALTTPIWCLVCGDYGGVDVLNNILLFIPFAAGLRLLGVPIRSIVAMGASISLTIEALQFSIIPGRDASLSDLLTNTLGSWIGAALANYGTQLLQPEPRLALRLAGVGAIAWLILQVTTAVLLRPWAPQGELRGAWGRSVPGRPAFDGRVTSAFLSGVPVPGDSTALDPELLNKIRQGRIRLELGFISGKETGHWSPVFEVRGRYGSVIGVDAMGRDLAFQPPGGSSALRLRRPALRLRNALPQEADTPVQLAAGARNDTLWAVWMLRDTRHQSLQVLSPSFGWSLITPIRYAYGPGVRLLTGLWIAAWLLPVGYWAARSGGRPPIRLGLLSLVLLTGLGLIPRLLEYPAVHWSEWLAGMAGIGLGWAGRLSATYLEARCDSPSTSGSC